MRATKTTESSLGLRLQHQGLSKDPNGDQKYQHMPLSYTLNHRIRLRSDRNYLLTQQMTVRARGAGTANCSAAKVAIAELQFFWIRTSAKREMKIAQSTRLLRLES